MNFYCFLHLKQFSKISLVWYNLYSSHYSSAEAASDTHSGNAPGDAITSSRLTGRQQFPCNSCPAAFKNKYLLQVHERSHSGDSPYHCNQCSMSFKSLANLGRHKRAHSRRATKNSSDGRALITARRTRRHNHNRAGSGAKPAPAATTGGGLTRGHGHKCTYCQKSFASKFALEIHLRMHTAEKPVACKVKSCSARFTQKGALALHFKRKHKSVVGAGKQGQGNSDGGKKGKGASRSRPHKCNFCPVSFRQKSFLLEHVRKHTGKWPYECPGCQKSFSRQDNLDRHARSHTGERPYKCPHCSKSFRQPTTLKIHVRQHTGEKPYKCTACSEAFCQVATLNYHFKRWYSG